MEKRKRSAGILHVLAAFFLMSSGSRYLDYNNSMHLALMVFLGVVIFTSVIYGGFRRRMDPKAKYNHWLRILQATGFIAKALVIMNLANIVIILSLFLWAAVAIMLVFTERKMLNPTEIGLGEKGVTIPGNYNDHLIPWSLVHDLVVRPDFVTITREDRSYVQLELTREVPAEEIDRMNTFARTQIESNKKEAVHDQ